MISDLDQLQNIRKNLDQRREELMKEPIVEMEEKTKWKSFIRKLLIEEIIVQISIQHIQGKNLKKKYNLDEYIYIQLAAESKYIYPKNLSF